MVAWAEGPERSAQRDHADEANQTAVSAQLCGAEVSRTLTGNRCLFCGGSAHLRHNCPVRAADPEYECELCEKVGNHLKQMCSVYISRSLGPEEVHRIREGMRTEEAAERAEVDLLTRRSHSRGR